jgi:hypothetical protein
MWWSVAVSANASVCVADSDPFYFYWSGLSVSMDGATNWSPLNFWTAFLDSMAVSADSTLVVGVAYGGGIYTWPPYAPSISTSPLSQTVPDGTNVLFSVAISSVSALPLAYQWQFNGTNLVAATNATLALTNVSQMESGSYAVLVTNIYGNELSGAAVLSVLPEVITTQPNPANQIVPSAVNITFGVSVLSDASVSYQWQCNGTNLVGATSATLSLSNVMQLNSGSYVVLVSNVFGTTLSDTAVLTVVPALLTTQTPDPSLHVADLMASITTGSEATGVWFEWGLDTNYGNLTPPVILQGPSVLSISNLITGLSPYTVYHYQAVASNVFGTAVGGDVSFTTVPKFVQVGTNTDWGALVLSADGSELVATSNGVICISTNLGVTFMPTTGTGSVFATSSNGSVILASNGTNIFASMDRGSTWTTNSAPTAFIHYAASSTGQDVVASDGSINVYTSTNFGATWNGSSLPFGVTCLASSAEGTQLYASSYTYNYASMTVTMGVYGSTNSGNTWTTLSMFLAPIMEHGLPAIACSADGSIIAAAGLISSVAISTNGAASWFYPFIPFSVYAVASSADGQTLLAGDSCCSIQVSPDTGTIWYAANVPGLYWAGTEAFMSSADGNTLAAFDGAIYLSLPPASQPSGLSVAANTSNGSPIFQLTGQPGYTYTVQASPDLVHWTTIATLVNTNCMVPFTDLSSSVYDQRFYRVIAPY